LTNRQRSFHGRSSLCDMPGEKGTRYTGWKVKGESDIRGKFLRTHNCCTGNRLLLPSAEDIPSDSGRPFQALSHPR
jgi:hypothetical protein